MRGEGKRASLAVREPINWTTSFGEMNSCTILRLFRANLSFVYSNSNIQFSLIAIISVWNSSNCFDHLINSDLFNDFCWLVVTRIILTSCTTW